MIIKNTQPCGLILSSITFPQNTLKLKKWKVNFMTFLICM